MSIKEDGMSTINEMNLELHERQNTVNRSQNGINTHTIDVIEQLISRIEALEAQQTKKARTE